MPGPDSLDELRARLRATQEAAERVVREVPPQGWSSGPERNAAADEIQALVTLLHALRDVVPPELWDEVREVIRQLLLLVRAFLDYAVARLEAERAAPAPAACEPRGPQDIPVA